MRGKKQRSVENKEEKTMEYIQYEITEQNLEAYKHSMMENEKSPATIEKYLRDVRSFCRWNQRASIDRTRILEWKNYLAREYAVSSANSMIAALNGFLSFQGWGELRVKPFRQQKQLYRDPERDMSRKEYIQLLEEAKKKGDERLKLVMETICATGIRVSELPFITAEAVRAGRAFVNCKNKKRIIFIPSKLQRLLKEYMKKKQITEGAVFLTRTGTVLNRSNIWSAMKKLSQTAGIEGRKVFPHNLRHLFAKTFYSAGKDLAKLADVLGHSHIETTRIYIMESGQEHERIMEQLGLVETDSDLFFLQGNRKRRREKWKQLKRMLLKRRKKQSAEEERLLE